MELQLCIAIKRKYIGRQVVRINFTENDLLEWTKRYIADHCEGESEVEHVDIDAIIP